MSTPEQPLTRRQLKEMRRTGALPVVDPAPSTPAEEPPHAGAPAHGEEGSGGLAGLPKASPVAAPPAADATERADAEPSRTPEPSEPVAAAAPAASDPEQPSEAPAPARPLTRRQARQLRTNEIPVGEQPGDAGAAEEPKAAIAAESTVADPEPSPKPVDAARVAEPVPAAKADDPRPAEPRPDPAPRAAAETQTRLPAGFTDALSAPDTDATTTADEAQEDRPRVGASFGAAVFQQAEERQRLERERAAREAQQRREAAATATVQAQPVAKPADESELFAEAFQRSLDAGGSTTATGTSLVLHDMPGTASLSAPMSATGELMITSSHVLPAGLASRGAAAGTTDGKDIDATLMDGEIPLHSSPTPIAASSAVSTSKAPGDVIRPPQREKNHGLMLTLGIVAGVLGVGLAGILIYAFATGVFG